MDVFIRQERVYYEVETLFGTGGVPATKFNQTVDKYDTAEDVRIVVPNFQCMLFLPDLLKFEQDLKKEGFDKLSFWTLDLHNSTAKGEEGLRRLKDVAKEVRRLVPGGDQA